MSQSPSSNSGDREFPKGSWAERYEIRNEVGNGAMAVVYRAWDRVLNRDVALKVLHRHLAEHRESKARLRAEAQAVAKLRHDRIVAIFDYAASEEKDSYLVTEFVDGQTLRQADAAGRIQPLELAEMMLHQICLALEHAHGEGVIHRDLKPENVMISSDGKIKLMDFGLAHVFDRERLTVTGQLLGSPAYMAPEQIEGKTVDARADLFSLGVMGYELLTAKLPFAGKNPHETLLRISAGNFTAPAEAAPRMSRRLSMAISRALAIRPGERWQSARELRLEIEQDLAEAGIGDPAAELARAWQEPAWSDQIAGRVVAALTQHGRRLYEQRRLATALDTWNRALMLRPDSRELLMLVARLKNRKRIAQILVISTVAVAVLSSGLALRRWMTTKPPDMPTQSELPAPLVAPAAPTPPVETKSTAAAESTQEERVAKPKAHTEKRRLHLGVFPPGNLRISLDDGVFEEYDPRRDFFLRAGAHKITLNSPCCFRETIQIAPHQSGNLSVRLRWRPARLAVVVHTISSNPLEADVLLDDRIAVRPGQVIDVPIDPSSGDGRRQVRLKAVARGFAPVARDVVLRAGERTEVSLLLTADRQP